jgi:FdhD protein
VVVSHQVPVLIWDKQNQQRRDDDIASEIPVALTYNKHSHVVMMATPADLEDFAIGFSLTEGIIDEPADLLDMSVINRETGLELAMTLGEKHTANLAEQRRNLVGRTGCGLCGARSLEQAMRAPAVVGTRVSVQSTALQAAIENLNDHQPLQVLTGAVHGAAWCSTDGEILALREDVGRHNALDKLIGHLRRARTDTGTGFALVSSRASYEMVYKAAAAGMEILLAVSAPTTLAVDFANRSGMTLVGFARPGRHNTYTFEGRIRNE